MKGELIILRNCAIYSSYFDLDELYEIISNIYKSKTIRINEDKTKISVISNKLFSKSVNSFNIMTSKTNPDEFSTYINRMYNFYTRVPAKNNDIKQKLLIKITTLNMVIGIESEKDISEEFYRELLTIAKKLDGIIFWGSREMLNSDGKLILDLDGNSEIEDFVVTAHTSHLDRNLKITDSGIRRKERSEKILLEKNIPFIEHLPPIVGEEDEKIRTKEEVVKRAVALCIVALKGECQLSGEDINVEKEIISTVISIFNAQDYFSPDEIEFLNNDNPKEEDSIQFTWRYECLWTLLWALGFIEKLEYPDKICDVAKSVSILKNFEDFNEFLNKSNLRSKGAILDEADLIYRYDWAGVDARIKGKQAPSELDSGIVVERHKTLNWLINYMDNEWDDVGTDT